MLPVDPRPRPIPRRHRAPSPDAGGETTRFGPYRAAHNLESILAELGDDKLARQMARHMSEFRFGINQLESLPNMRFRKWFVERFAEWYRATLTETVLAKETGRRRVAWTHLVCVLTACARDRVRDINSEIHEAWLEETRETRAAASRRDRAAALRKKRKARVEPEAPEG